MFNCFISGEGVFADATFEKGDFFWSIEVSIFYINNF